MEYPTDAQLELISLWTSKDLPGLMEYIKPLWNYADVGYWEEKDGEYHISTGGWSGNEEIISYMRQNQMWWIMYWYQSRRGGHYIFKK